MKSVKFCKIITNIFVFPGLSLLICLQVGMYWSSICITDTCFWITWLKMRKKNSPLCKSVFNQTGMLLHQLVPIQTGCWEIHSWKCRPQPVHTPDLRLLCNQPLKWDNNVRVEWWCSLQILQCPQEQVRGWNITLTVALFSIINNKSVQGSAAVLAWTVKWYSNNF